MFTEVVSSIEGSVVLRDLQLKTSYDNRPQPLLGPFSPGVHVQATWGRHSGPAEWPIILAYVDCGLMQVHCGQEHVLCLELVSQHVGQFLKVYNVKCFRFSCEGVEKTSKVQVHRRVTTKTFNSSYLCCVHL